MSSNTLVASSVEQGPKRRSFPGSQDGVKAPGRGINVTASTSQVSPAPAFKSNQSFWFSKVVKREAPLLGLLATGTAMVVLNQVIADQVPKVLCLCSNTVSANLKLTGSLPSTGYS